MFPYAYKLMNKFQSEEGIGVILLWDFRSSYSPRSHTLQMYSYSYWEISSTEYVTSVMKTSWAAERSSNWVQMLIFALQKKIGRGTIIKSVFDCRLNTNKHTHMFLFVAQAFWVFIVRICFFWCAIWVYLKSMNGGPACECWTQTSWHVMQRDSDSTTLLIAVSHV